MPLMSSTGSSQRIIKMVSRWVRLYERMIAYLQSKLNERQFLIFSSVLVGISSALAAILLKELVFNIHYWFFERKILTGNFLIIAFLPMAGILLTAWIIQRYFNGKLGGGNAHVIYSVLYKQSRLPAPLMFSHILTSAITVGMGGSSGLETPIVTTGAAFGSNYGKTYQVSSTTRTLLLASGVAAGISAAFNAPIAGVLFALEVIVTELKIAAFIPLLIASASGAILSKIILNDDILLTFSLQEPFNYRNVPFYILLGILAGLISVYYTAVFSRIEKIFGRVKKKYFVPRAIISGSILALLIMIFPPLLGEGYSSIKLLALQNPLQTFDKSILGSLTNNTWMLLLFSGIIIFIKAIATSLTIGGGGNGGNFAPSLFVGAYFGFVFASLLNATGWVHVPVSNFTIVAMAGILSGIFHAPLTGIFLIAEITGGYDLIVPLMIVSALSFAISKYIQPLSLDRIKLQAMGVSGHVSGATRLFNDIKVAEIIETNFELLLPEQSLFDVRKAISRSQRNVFPVVDSENNFLGIITMDAIRDILFETEKIRSLKVKDLVQGVEFTSHPDDTLDQVLNTFDRTHTWNLPVTDNGKYLGFVSKSSILDKLRTILHAE